MDQQSETYKGIPWQNYLRSTESSKLPNFYVEVFASSACTASTISLKK